MQTAPLCFTKLLLPVASLVAGLMVPPVASADAPGQGLTGTFEQDYLKFIIDHHYSALRMTELAAGTDTHRDLPVSPGEGTAPTPDTNATQAKAAMNEIKSIARRSNGLQREEILTAQGFLKQWYGIDHTPQIRPECQAQLQLLERAPTGQQFDHLFLGVFSRHHYRALQPSLTCIVASDLQHDALHRYCNGIVHAQISSSDHARTSFKEIQYH